MSGDIHRRSAALMGTIVNIDVIAAHQESAAIGAQRQAAVERAFEWFRQIEACCTRFNPESELMHLSAQIGVAFPVTDLLYETLQFALVVAEASGGAFDPTMGIALETSGFNRNYLTGAVMRTERPQDLGATASGVCSAAKARGPHAEIPELNLQPIHGRLEHTSYKDVYLDPATKSIMLLRPLVLDLGAVAKGLAIDIAARELRPLANFAIDAGGDIYLAGTNPQGAPWTVGIRHPRLNDDLIDATRVSGSAVCTSGDYERRSEDGVGHHILDPRTGECAMAAISATVIAPSAMLADALATAAFVLGPADGIALLEKMGVEGLIVAPSLEVSFTRGLAPRVQGNPAQLAIHAAQGSSL